MMLADLGADVIKVEAHRGRLLPRAARLLRLEPRQALDRGEPEGSRRPRHRPPPGPRAPTWSWRTCAPAWSSASGVDYETLRAINPRLIYSTVTAFGSDGPYTDRPGFDPLLQAMGGVMALQGFGGAPQYLRIAATDYYMRGARLPGDPRRALRARAHGQGPARADLAAAGGARAAVRATSSTTRATEVVYRETPTYRLYQAGDGEWFFLARRQPVVLGQALQGGRPRGSGRGPALRLLARAARQRGRADAAARGGVRVQARGGVAAHPGRPRHPGRRRRSRSASSCTTPRCSTTRWSSTYEHPELGPLSLMGQPLRFSETPVPDAGPPPHARPAHRRGPARGRLRRRRDRRPAPPRRRRRQGHALMTDATTTK